MFTAHHGLRVIFVLLLLLVGNKISIAQAVSVTEVTMAAPDIVHVILRDPEFQRGNISGPGTVRSDPVGTWIQDDAGWAMVIGPKRDYLRRADMPPTIFLDRAAIDDASGYGMIGARSVAAVYRKSMPYQSGMFPASNGDTREGASFQYDVYIQLNGPLDAGDFTISWPNDVLPDTPFSFDDYKTRASSIHVTQSGHRAADTSKVGYLSLWLPGADQHGAVDFRLYGIDAFDIIDSAGKSVFTGTIALRASPDTSEPGNGLSADLLTYVDAAAAPIRLLGLSGETMTTDGRHQFEAGQKVALERLGGEQDAGALFATVASADANSFTLKDIEGQLPQAIEPGAKASLAFSANRAGTYVFELDYSLWRPTTDGQYHLRIAGLGISDPLIISDGVWRTAAVHHLGGLYNHHSGNALDGRFGYTRPAAFRPGVDVSIAFSRLPLAWTSELEGFIPFPEAASPEWITDVAVPDNYWGGYMDAGDWDRRIQHVDVANLLLEVLEMTPSAGQIDSGLPKSADALDLSIYAETDDLPDLVHEAIWVLDFFRRLQDPDGAIHGGIESAAHPLRGVPSYLEHQAVFAYAPDHISSFRYAGVAANLSRVLKGLQHDELAALYEESAIAAWKAGERGFSDPDSFYAEAISIASQSGAFSEVSWEQRRNEMAERATGYRLSAAASLYRLTRDKSYAAIFESGWRAGPDFFAATADAAWQYLKSPETDAGLVAAIKDRFNGEAVLVVDAQSGFAYPSLKHPWAPSGWGQGGAPAYFELLTLMRSHQLTGNPKILRALEQEHHVMLGANQLGLSLVSGFGVRTAVNALHEDRIAMGVPVPPGITIYGWAPQDQTAYGWVFGPPWSSLPEVGTDENAASRRIEPSRFALPYAEYLVQHPAVIMQQEYTVQQTISTMAALAIYVDGHE